MTNKIKITVDCPKGKAEKSMNSFRNMFSLVNKPIEAAVINDTSFYLIYTFAKYKDMEQCINLKIPKAMQKIRATYWSIIHVTDRCYKLATKFKWNAIKTTRFIISTLNKKLKDEPIHEAITLEDRDDIVNLLATEFIQYEILESDNV